MNLESQESLDHLFRHSAGQMTATLTRVLGVAQIDLVEDVVQEALLQALKEWPYHGVPERPAAWLIQVAKNRAIDALRRTQNFREKEWAIRGAMRDREDPDQPRLSGELSDDQLAMIFACCDPRLPESSQVALTLKTVGGFSVDEIARAYLVSSGTAAQRIVRAKRALRLAGAPLQVPAPEELGTRLPSVLRVVYLMFNEGYATHGGDDLVRHDLCDEAIRLACMVADHPATSGARPCALAALCLFHGSRLEARTNAAGELVRLADQDRTRWDRDRIRLGLEYLRRSASGANLDSLHLEAEIACLHATAPSAAQTDWARILECYDELYQRDPNEVIAVQRVVALAEVHGAEMALETIEASFPPDERAYAPARVVRAEMLMRVGREAEAASEFERAADQENNPTQAAHLRARARALS